MGRESERYDFPDIPNLTRKFQDKELTGIKIVSEIDWPDKNMLNRSGIKLGVISLDKRINLGKNIIQDLHTGLSDRTIGGIFIMAWNLCEDLRGTRIFPRSDITKTDRDIKYRELETYQEPQRQYTLSATYAGSDQIIAEGLSFFCGSLLRLFTKSTDNYLRAWDTIKRTFSSFYETSFPIRNFMPQREMIENLKAKFNSGEVYRNTLTGLLTTEHDQGSTASGIRNFLYEMHLAFTGMHSFTLCLLITKRMKITPTKLLAAAYHTTTQDAIEEIADVLVHYDQAHKNEDYKLETWKFARIFSPRYFAKIHSRKCPELITIFSAMVAKLEDQENRNNNVFQIAQVGVLSQATLAKYKEIGTRLYVQFMGEPGAIDNPVRKVMGSKKQRSNDDGHEESQEDTEEEDMEIEIMSDFEDN